VSENLLDRLAEIREKQGREPIDGTRIQGFAELPPPEWTPPTQTDPPWHEDPDEAPEPEKEVSPLVRAALPEKPPVQPLPQIPMPDLAVLDSLASYQGHDVKLNDSETRQVKAVIVKALQRDLRDKMAALREIAPRRQRKSKPADPAASSEAPVRKRRGRPRGSLLK
jgi:hypothetical protein